MRSDELYIRDMLIACEDIGSFVSGSSLAEFTDNRMMRRAVVQALTDIGEGATRISDELKDEYPDTAWADARAFRNFAVHEYFSIVWQVVWETATIDIPIFKAQLEAIVAAEFPNEANK